MPIAIGEVFFAEVDGHETSVEAEAGDTLEAVTLRLATRLQSMVSRYTRIVAVGETLQITVIGVMAVLEKGKGSSPPPLFSCSGGRRSVLA